MRRSKTATTLNRTAAGVLAVVLAGAVVSPVHAAGATGADRARTDQWHVAALDLAAAHRISQGEGVRVGVMDTGVYADHQDLRGNVLPGLDLTGRSSNGWLDTDSHGTAMVSAIVGHGHGANGADGFLGVAPKAKVVPVKIAVKGTDNAGWIMGNSETATNEQFASGVDWLVSQGVKIISISYAGPQGEAVKAAFLRAKAAGVLMFAGAGNKPSDLWPSTLSQMEGVTAVGATNRTGGLAAVTVDPLPKVWEIEVCAPGEEILNAGIRSQSSGRIGTGTSPSTALVAGLAALIWSKYPTLSADEVLWRILATARDMGETGRDPATGFGAIDPVAALAPGGPGPSPAASTRNDDWPGLTATAGTTTAAAVAESGGGIPGVLVGLAGAFCLLLLVVGVAVAAIWRRRERGEQSPAAAASPGPAPAEPPVPRPPLLPHDSGQ